MTSRTRARPVSIAEGLAIRVPRVLMASRTRTRPVSTAEGLAMRVRLLARSRIRWVEIGAGWFNAAQLKADFVYHSVLRYTRHRAWPTRVSHLVLVDEFLLSREHESRSRAERRTFRYAHFSLSGTVAARASSDRQVQDRSAAAWPAGPVNCVEGSWGGFGACIAKPDQTCGAGNGRHTRQRIGDVGPQHGGQACGASTQTRDCDLAACQHRFKVVGDLARRRGSLEGSSICVDSDVGG